MPIINDTDIKKAELQRMMTQLSDENVRLLEKFECGIISKEELQSRVEQLKNEELRIKEAMIMQYHIGPNGPLSLPKKPNYRKGTYFRVKTATGRELTAKNYRDLIEYLMKEYDITTVDKTFKGTWEASMSLYKELHPGKDKTILAKQFDFKRFVNDELARKDIRTIDNEYLDIYCINLIKRLKLSPSAFKAFKSVLNDVFEYAIRHSEYGISINPAKLVDNKNCYSYCSKSASQRTNAELILSTEQMDSIVATFKSRAEKRYYVPYYAAILQRATGERPGEIFALKWEDVIQRKTGKVLFIRRQQLEHRLDPDTGKTKLWYEVVDGTKNEKGQTTQGREFPVTEELESVLSEIRKAQDEAGIVTEWILSDIHGNFFKKGLYYASFTAVCKNLGIPLLGSYTFRREMNCRLERLNIPSSERAALLGHSPETNSRWYTTAEVGHITRAREALNSL